ncbi:MAG: hypothetical protein P8020_20655 [Acidobacteriota bacterium]
MPGWRVKEHEIEQVSRHAVSKESDYMKLSETYRTRVKGPVAKKRNLVR